MLALNAWLSRQAGWMLPTSLVVGYAVPWLAERTFWLIFYIMPPVLFFTTLNISLERLQGVLQRPIRLGLALVWVQFGMGLSVWLACSLLNLPSLLSFCMVLTACAGPVFTAGPLAVWYRLDVETTLSVLLLATLCTPLSILMGLYLLGSGTDLVWLGFLARISFYLIIPMGLAFICLKTLSQSHITSLRNHTKGLPVLLISLFGIGIMAGALEATYTNPLQVLGFLIAIMAYALLSTEISRRLFAFMGTSTAQGIALLSGIRNVGVTFVLIEPLAPEGFLLYVGLAQLPVYASPFLLRAWGLRPQ